MRKSIAPPKTRETRDLTQRPSLDIGQIILNAHVFNFQRTDDVENQLLQTVTVFFDTLAGKDIDYLLVGGVALLNYVEGRNTEDIDLILSAADIEELDDLTVVEQDGDFVRASWRELRIDLLLTENALFAYVMQHCATKVDLQGREIPCSTVEGLLLLKFYALPHLYRQGNFNKVALYETDITMLLHSYSVDVEVLFEQLGNYLSAGDMESLRTIYEEIETKIRRFDDST
ncbi:MAG: hypothetical protein MAG451_01231 [Anaerolineales bacterium]|nr:hypothetical protein [Anaerolineales bacterium]